MCIQNSSTPMWKWGQSSRCTGAGPPFKAPQSFRSRKGLDPGLSLEQVRDNLASGSAAAPAPLSVVPRVNPWAFQASFAGVLIPTLPYPLPPPLPALSQGALTILAGPQSTLYIHPKHLGERVPMCKRRGQIYVELRYPVFPNNTQVWALLPIPRVFVQAVGQPRQPGALHPRPCRSSF